MSETKAVETKKEPGMAQLVIILFAISAITALLLGLVNMITTPAILANAKAKNEKAMADVLPADGYEQVEYVGDDANVKAVYKAGDAGYVVQVECPGSFGGGLEAMVGVDAEGTVTGVEIVKTAETSGLGANAGKPAFKDQFKGLTGTAAVAKDGGSVDAITGATITSRAVCNGVNSAVAAAASMG